MNTLCGQNQTFVGNKFGSGENPPRHYLSGKMGPVIERDCDLVYPAWACIKAAHCGC